MFDHATIPGLPPHLWQIAFFMDMIKKSPTHVFSEETSAMADRFGRKCNEVIVWRKKKLGW